MLSQIKQKSLGNPNEGLTMPESVVLPKELQEIIDNYFTFLGELEDMEETGWDFLVSAAHGIEDYGLDMNHYTQWLFMYRMTYQLVKYLNQFVTPKVSNQTHTTI